MTFFLFFSLLSTAAWPALKSAEPGQESEIMEHVRLGHDAYERYEQLRDIEKTRREHGLLAQPGNIEILQAWKSAAMEMDELKQQAHYHLNHAAKLTRSYYGIAPEEESWKYALQTIQNGPLKGRNSSLRMVFSDEEYIVVHGLPRPPNHYFRNALRDEDGNLLAATTWEDGLITIRPEIFKNALKLGSPRLLAATLYHELVHFERLTTTGWASTEEEEVYAYSQLLKTETATALGLTSTDTDNITNAMKRNAGKILAGKAESPFTTPEEEAQHQEAWDKIQDDLRRAKEERIRIKAKLEEELRRQEEQKELLERYAQAARSCGFEVFDKTSWYAYGFRRPDPSYPAGSIWGGTRYYYKRNFTLDQAKALFLLAETCSLRYGPIADTTTACDDGLEVINRRWSEPGFKDAVEIEGQDEECVRRLRDDLRAPIDSRKLNRTSSRIWDDIRERKGRENEEARRRNERDNTERERHRREDPDDEYKGPCGNLGSSCTWKRRPS